MFDAIIVKPIFNLLVFIYALLPGHNFGVSIIIFTVLVRLLMWPLVKKQLHHAKAMRELQPELKRIKQETKGDRQKESMMVMELYKERQISPFGSLGLVAVQLVIFIGLYHALRKVVIDPKAIIEQTYPIIRDMSWVKQLGSDISQFDATLLGFVDLTKSALPKTGGIYWPAMFIVIGSAIAQYFQSVQLLPKAEDGRSLRQILKDASAGKPSDASETNAAVSRSMRFLLPGLIFIFTVGLPAALGLYWLVSGVTAYFQQARVLKQDETELESIADETSSSSTDGKKQVIEGEVIEKPKAKKPAKKKSAAKRKKRK